MSRSKVVSYRVTPGEYAVLETASQCDGASFRASAVKAAVERIREALNAIGEEDNIAEHLRNVLQGLEAEHYSLKG